MAGFTLFQEYKNVERINNTIKIYALNHAQCAEDFLKCIHSGKKAGYQEFSVVFVDIAGCFPNAAVPIAGIIDYFQAQGIGFNCQNADENLIGILNPHQLPQNEEDLSRCLGKIWKFTSSEDIYKIQMSLINELRRNERFGNGILEGIEWSINEIMDNVLVHSGYICGFIMGQLHKNAQHVAFTIYDAGQGIYNSLRKSVHAPRKAVDALTLCIKEGVTRDKKIGQGNGMYGLYSLVTTGNGSLKIISGRGQYSYQNGSQKTFEGVSYLSDQNQATTVDFILDYSQDISIKKVLTFQGRSFDFINIYAEDLENDQGELVFKITEIAEGTGTRESAMRLKNEMMNLLHSTHKKIVLDFSGVNVITSSFIDELVAKLLIELGLFQFNNYVKLVGMGDTLQQTLQKSVVQRIIDEYKS